MHNQNDPRSLVLQICRETFSHCMRAAVHCTNDLQMPANDPSVVALMDCADACYASIGFSQQCSNLQRDAIHTAAARCSEVIRTCDAIDDQQVAATVAQCQRCLGQVREWVGGHALSLAV